MSQLPNNPYPDNPAGGGFGAPEQEASASQPTAQQVEPAPMSAPAPGQVPGAAPMGGMAGGFGGQVGGGGFVPTGPPPKTGVFSKIGKGTMLLFATLVLAVVTVAIVSQQSGPKSADADQDVLRKIDIAIAAYKANPAAARQRTHELFADTEAVEKAFYGFAEQTQVPAEELKQNPFVHRAPKDPDADRKKQEESWREKERKQKEAEETLRKQRERIEEALKRLNIQTILYSDENPMVLISNRVYRTGDQLGIFVISKIHHDSLVLKVGDQVFLKNLD